MKISIFTGDVSDAPAEALCTSTNPRLSLVMGTGASIRSRGGFEILRACEAIVDADELTSGSRGLMTGSVHTTTAGQLPAKIIVHCVASDASHRSSSAIIRSCVTGALAAADAAGCASVAMPLFGTGHARFKIENAVFAIAEVLRDAKTDVPHVIVVVHDAEDVSDAVRVMRCVIPNCEIDVADGLLNAEEIQGTWSSAWGEHDEI